MLILVEELWLGGLLKGGMSAVVGADRGYGQSCVMLDSGWGLCVGFCGTSGWEMSLGKLLYCRQVAVSLSRLPGC